MTSHQCPACGASLRHTPAGETHCPACGKTFKAAGTASALRKGAPTGGAAVEAGPKRKRKRKEKKGFLAGRGLVVAAAGGTGLALIVVIVGLVLLISGGRRDGSESGPGSDGRGKDPAADLVVFDTALPGEAVPAAAASSPVIVPAPPPGPPVPLPRPRPPAEEAAPGPAARAAWNIPADPAPRATPLRYAAGLRVRLETARIASHYLLKYLPLTADMDGPFALFFPAPENLNRSVPPRAGAAPGSGLPPPPLLDLRTGRPAGTFAATSPYWRDARLSPTGEYLVGPDSGPNCQLQPERNTLFVWKRGAERFTRKLTLPGPVAWLGFVAADRLAVQTFDPKPALQVWDVTTGKVLHTVRLTAEQLPAPGAGFTVPQRDLHTFYRPWPPAGAVSPGGRYVALGTRAGVTLVDVAAGKEVGTLPIPGLTTAQADSFRGLSFRPDGAELYALTETVRSLDLRLRSWSVTDGRPLLELKLEWAAGIGPPRPGPEPGTFLLPGGSVGPGLGVYGYVYPFRATMVKPAAIVEVRCGSVVSRLDSCVLGWAEDGPILVAGGPKQSGPMARPDERWDRGVPQEVFTVALDRPGLVAAARARVAGLAPRPPVVRPDRSVVKQLTPEPPAAWAAPPRVRPAGPARVRLLEADFPAAFGAEQAAILRFEYRLDVRQRFEMHWDRYDLRSGARVGPGTMLWPWARDPGRMKQHESALRPPTPAAALTGDGARLAVCDPADRSRVDVWTADGRRLLGFHPAGPGQEVGWLGWSPQGRLLTVAGGSLTAWEVPGARAVFEAAGGYAAPVAAAGGGKWLAVAAGGHVDLLDGASGACLGRCRAGGVAGAVRDLALSADGRRLAVVFASPADRQAKGKYTAQLWDLDAGRADLLTFGGDPYATVCWAGPEHLAAFAGGQVLYDLAVRRAVALYQFADPDRSWHGPLLARSPDGRVWFRRANARPRGAQRPRDARLPPGVWWAITEAELLGGPQSRLAERPRAAVVPRRFPVRVEVDLGTDKRGQTFARPVAEQLRKQGFSTGPKGWCLRVTHRVIDTGKELTLTGPIQVPEFIPAVHLKWVLCDAEGNQVWERTTVGRFAWHQSKYYTGTTREPFRGRPGLQWVKAHFHFGGRPMREAIADEILDTLAQQPTPLGELPTAWLKVGKEYRLMPLQINPIGAWPAPANGAGRGLALPALRR
jgi:hypothetical protein